MGKHLNITQVFTHTQSAFCNPLKDLPYLPECFLCFYILGWRYGGSFGTMLKLIISTSLYFPTPYKEILKIFKHTDILIHICCARIAFIIIFLRSSLKATGAKLLMGLKAVWLC